MKRGLQALCLLSLLVGQVAAACRGDAPRTRAASTDTSASATPSASSSTTADWDAGGHVERAVPPVSGGERTIHFAWRPRLGSQREYFMPDAADQHRMVLSRGVERGGTYPVVIAMHGQPRRGQAPRSYAFPRVVVAAARELLDDASIRPHILVLPVFRFDGQNWPHFSLRAFVQEIESRLAEQGLKAGGFYLFGHSGAAGCGGEGLNSAASVSPQAVGFFDTCVGSDFLRAVKELEDERIPTLVLHSVETAGYRPRQPSEYDAEFDFGKVYARLGLKPSACPLRLPEAPLRALAYRCARNESSTVRAFVIDTGVGERAHDAVVRLGTRFFLREFLASSHADGRSMSNVELN